MTLCGGEGAEQFYSELSEIGGLKLLEGVTVSAASVGTLGALMAPSISANPIPLSEQVPLYLKEFTVKKQN